MPYRVKKDGATINKKVGTRRSIKTGKDFPILQGRVYKAGVVIPDSDVDDYTKEAVKNGEAHISSLLEYVSGGVSQESEVSNLSDTFQAEGGGPLDEPRKVQRALTGLDIEQREDYAEVVNQPTEEESKVAKGGKSTKSSRKS